jgi:hypothetical protein
LRADAERVDRDARVDGADDAVRAPGAVAADGDLDDRSRRRLTVVGRARDARARVRPAAARSQFALRPASSSTAARRARSTGLPSRPPGTTASALRSASRSASGSFLAAAATSSKKHSAAKTLWLWFTPRQDDVRTGDAASPKSARSAGMA